VFIQVIQGQVSDAGQVKAALERWSKDLQPGSSGWLGTTAGVTEDGRFIALARFESEEAAQRNSDRPEQGEWWAETAKLFTSDPTFSNSKDVMVDVNGDPDDATFVQVMQGRSSDPERAKELMSDDSVDWAAFRPEIIASVGCGHSGGAYTMAIYFTSEEAAREGEKKEPPPELTAQMEEMDKLSVGTPEFYDLKDPWLISPS
jgi:hypothetical protein